MLKNEAPYWLDVAVKQLEVPLTVTAPADSGCDLLRKVWDEIYLRLDVINAPGTFNPKKTSKEYICVLCIYARTHILSQAGHVY